MTDALSMTTAPLAVVLVAAVTFKVMHCRCQLLQKVAILVSSWLMEYLVSGTKPTFTPYSQALRSSAWVTAVASSSCSLSKLLAAREMMGVSLKGFFVLDVIMVFQRTGPGMTMAEPLNPSRPFASGAGMLAASLADSHSARFCVCVYVFLASGYGWGTVMHEIPTSSFPISMTSLPYPRTQ